MESALIKRALGRAAAERIVEGMVVGLGSGTTIEYFIEALGERVRRGLSIKGCSTSQLTSRWAMEAKIPLVSIGRTERIDIAVDGADLVDKEKRMIKGRGAALLREKIVATAAERTLILIEERKLVLSFSDALLPIEVVPVADLWILKELEKLGLSAKLRLLKSGAPLVTDNHNHILDIELKGRVKDPQGVDRKIRAIPGVVETGFFFGLATTILVGRSDGGIEEWS